MTQPAWFDRKACTTEPFSLFWPVGRATTVPDFAPALAICARCPVVAECRADAEHHGDIVGGHTTQGQVVGGCAPKQRTPGVKERPMRLCYLPGCVRWFTVRGSGANMYCSPECAAAARKVSRSRRRGAA